MLQIQRRKTIRQETHLKHYIALKGNQSNY